MDWLLDSVQRLAVWIVTGIIGTVSAWMLWVTVTIHRQHTRLKLLEQSVNSLPEKIAEIKLALEQSRKDREAQIDKVFREIKDLRKELKADIDANRRDRTRRH